jgi:hypothetical protein
LGVEFFEVEITIEKSKICKWLGIDHIPAQSIQAGGKMLHSEIYGYINCILNKGKLPWQWKEFIIVPIYKNGNKTVIIIKEYH